MEILDKNGLPTGKFTINAKGTLYRKHLLQSTSIHYNIFIKYYNKTNTSKTNNTNN